MLRLLGRSLVPVNKDVQPLATGSAVTPITKKHAYGSLHPVTLLSHYHLSKPTDSS